MSSIHVVGIFHTGVGDRHVADSRRVAVSIHADGLEYVHNLSRPLDVPVRECRPWFYRNDHPSLSETRININPVRYVDCITLKRREAIQSLIDQPGRCLRDAHDSINFVELEGRDLSEVPTPMSEGSSWVLINNGEKMTACVKEIEEAQPSEIAFDMEMYNQSMYNQFTCLIQLSTDAGKDYVIDVLAPGVWEKVTLLAPLFANPSIVKVGHAIGGMDVPALHRDFGVFVVNAFDTYEAARVLRLKHTSLASVCEHYGLRSSSEYATLKKEYQKSDWRRRPLSEDMLKYGLYDAHYLLELRRLLVRDLARGELWDDAGIGREAEAQIVSRALAATMRKARDIDHGEREVNDKDHWKTTQSTDMSDVDGYYTPTEVSIEVEECKQGGNGGFDTSLARKAGGEREERTSIFRAKELRMNCKLMKVITVSQDRCLALWKPKEEPHMKNALLISFMRRAATGDGKWNDSHQALYQRLVDWRKHVALTQGVVPTHVCPLDLLVLISCKRPDCELNLRRLSYFLPESLNEDCTNEILSLVRSSYEEDEERSHLRVRFYTDRSRRVQTDRAKCKDLGSEKDETAHVQTREDDQSHPLRRSTRTKRSVGAKEPSFWKSAPKHATLAVPFVALGALVLFDVMRKKKN